uniref:BTB domain-containing protein n=1 Tax=Parastrongyloides trichosuri TaxID=131310 RepID=A0A0N4Z3J0_PARTI
MNCKKLTFCSDTQTNILNEKQWFDEYKKKIQLQEQKEGTLKIEVSDLSFLDNTITEYVSIQNILWSLSFDFKYSLENDDDVLIGTIVCNPKISSYSWVCKAAVEIRIKNSFNKCNAIIKKHYHYFSYDNDTINIHLTEKKILSNKNYSNINKFIIEAKVEIIEISGTMEKKIYDFTIPGNESNAAFNIKGNILYVNKEYLSLYSPVMKRMFMLTTDKPIKNTVMLENINIIYFVELLNVLYPYHKGVSERNINYLLEMAEFFEISYLFKECEDFLIRTEKIS